MRTQHVEVTNDKIARKIERTTAALEAVTAVASLVTTALRLRPGKKYADIAAAIDAMKPRLALDSLESLENEYRLAVLRVFWMPVDDRSAVFHRVLGGENFIARFNEITMTARSYASALVEAMGKSIMSRDDARPLLARMVDARSSAEIALGIDVPVTPERDDYEVCACGEHMSVIPELSELHCACGAVKPIVGTVFRDEHCAQDGQKPKHGGYDPSKHYRLWIDRIQAVENKTFDADTLARIEYVLTRDRYDRQTLTCERMRAILKDTKVGETSLNDHAPLLIKRFGGPSPPVLTFHEHRLLFTRFTRMMALYGVVRPGPGNKRYYPYFIYKIIEREFSGNPEKLRLIDSIHLQSRDTVIKNDIIFKQICALSDPADNFVYRPTDPSGRC